MMEAEKRRPRATGETIHIGGKAERSTGEAMKAQVRCTKREKRGGEERTGWEGSEEKGNGGGE